MSAAETSQLQPELGMYERHKREWLQSHAEQFVVIKGEELLGFFPSFDSAFCAGAERFGRDADFLVKRVVTDDPVFVVY